MFDRNLRSKFHLQTCGLAVKTAPNVATSCMRSRCVSGSQKHMQQTEFFVSTHLMHAEQTCIYGAQSCSADTASSRYLPIYNPDSHSADMAWHHKKHRCMISITRSCCSGVIMLSLGKQSPRRKISAPTSIPEPFI